MVVRAFRGVFVSVRFFVRRLVVVGAFGGVLMGVRLFVTCRMVVRAFRGVRVGIGVRCRLVVGALGRVLVGVSFVVRSRVVVRTATPALVPLERVVVGFNDRCRVLDDIGEFRERLGAEGLDVQKLALRACLVSEDFRGADPGSNGRKTLIELDDVLVEVGDFIPKKCHF